MGRGMSFPPRVKPGPGTSPVTHSTGTYKVRTTPSSLWLKGNRKGKKAENNGLNGSVCKLNQMYCSKFTVGHLFFFLISFQYRMKG